MMTTSYLETPRLCLRPLTIDDAPAIQRLFPQWEVVRFLLGRVPWPYPDDGALTFLSDVVLPSMSAGTMWAWSIRLKTDPNRLIGVINLRLGDDNRGFWLDPDLQRRGLMTEAVEVVTSFWFEELDQDLLRTHKAASNEASCRLSEREGMRMTGIDESDLVGGRRLPSRTYELTQREWRLRRDLTSR